MEIVLFSKWPRFTVRMIKGGMAIILSVWPQKHLSILDVSIKSKEVRMGWFVFSQATSAIDLANIYDTYHNVIRYRISYTQLKHINIPATLKVMKCFSAALSIT